MTTAPTPTGRPGGPWWLRCVPVLALVALIVTGGALASPTLRRQLEVSSHRLATPYVELAFVSPTAARACSHDDAEGLQVALTSHLARTTAFGWRAGRAHGTLRVAPGSVGLFSVPVPRAARATITVTLDERPERLVLHCGGSTT